MAPPDHEFKKKIQLKVAVASFSVETGMEWNLQESQTVQLL